MVKKAQQLKNSQNEKKSGVLTQIVVPVVVALIIGGASPWWWEMLFHHKSDPIKPRVEGQPALQPTSDFPGGSKPVYSADFRKWPMAATGLGSFGYESGAFVIRPTGEAWVGLDRQMPITPLEGDFVFDVWFRIDERAPSGSLEVQLNGGGDNADYVRMSLQSTRTIFSRKTQS